MTDQNRLAQLRVLLDRLERMPASPDRDYMLAEVRSRAVDIDTGIAPRPMRPLESAMTLDPEHEAIVVKRTPKAAPPKPAQRRPATPPAPAPSPPRAAGAPAWQVTLPKPAVPDDSVDLLALDGLLSLGDDTPAPEAADSETRTSRPWAGGLRG